MSQAPGLLTHSLGSLALNLRALLALGMLPRAIALNANVLGARIHAPGSVVVDKMALLLTAGLPPRTWDGYMLQTSVRRLGRLAVLAGAGFPLTGDGMGGHLAGVRPTRVLSTHWPGNACAERAAAVRRGAPAREGGAPGRRPRGAQTEKARETRAFLESAGLGGPGAFEAAVGEFAAGWARGGRDRALARFGGRLPQPLGRAELGAARAEAERWFREEGRSAVEEALPRMLADEMLRQRGRM